MNAKKIGALGLFALAGFGCTPAQQAAYDRLVGLRPVVETPGCGDITGEVYASVEEARARLNECGPGVPDYVGHNYVDEPQYAWVFYHGVNRLAWLTVEFAESHPGIEVLLVPEAEVRS